MSGDLSNYLVRPLGFFLGSWGADGNGMERVFVCGTESVCDDGIDDDLDTLTDCLDPDCDGVSGRELGTELTCDDSIDNDADGTIDCDDADCVADPACLFTFQFTDTLADDLAETDLFDVLNPLTVDSGDYVLFQIDTGSAIHAMCSTNADFYRDNYIALAPAGDKEFSGTWNRWGRSPGTADAWALDNTSRKNKFGTDCDEEYAWCMEENLLPDRIFLTVRPGASGGQSECESQLTGQTQCSDGTWVLTIRIGATRLATCGF